MESSKQRKENEEAERLARQNKRTQQKTYNLFWPDENIIEHCSAAHIVQGCQQ